MAVGGKPAPTFNLYIGDQKLNVTIEAFEEESDGTGIISYKGQLEYNADRTHNGQNLKCEVIHTGYTTKQIVDSENIVEAKLNLKVCNDHGSNQNHGNDNPCGPCLIGYQGDNCGSCMPGYFPASGITGKVNLTTSKGVICEGKVFETKSGPNGSNGVYLGL